MVGVKIINILNLIMNIYILLFYINDMIITSNNSSLVLTFITQLFQEFSMDDLYYSLRIETNEKGLFLG
jgi:ABC-type protease/lipase transport system fused ATPase/permease subunit